MRDNILSLIKTVVDKLLVIVSLILLSLIVSNILGRLVNVSFMWANEIARLLFIWVCVLGIVSGIFSDEHMRMELFSSDSRFGYILKKVSKLLFFIFTAYIGYSGILAVRVHIQMGRTLKTLPSIPFWYFTIIIPICFLLAAVILFLHVIDDK